MSKSEVKPEVKPEAAPGTAVAAPASTAVVNWKERMAAIKAEAVKAEEPVGGFISLKGGFMQYGERVIPNNVMECVILGYVFENCWYPKPYSPDKIVSPACYAFSKEETGMAPHPESEDPQGGEEGLCLGCPNGEWGSSPNGAGPWCRQSRRLVLLPTNAILTPDTVRAFEPVFMKLPPTSVPNLTNYVLKVDEQLDLPLLGVVSEISVKPHPKYLFQVHYKPVRPIVDQEILSALVTKYERMMSFIKPYPKNESTEEKAKSGKY